MKSRTREGKRLGERLRQARDKGEEALWEVLLALSTIVGLTLCAWPHRLENDL